MKKFHLFRVFIATALILSSANCFAQKDPNSGSTLHFDELTWDFGKIKEADGPVSHTFIFTNKGSTAVVLEQVSVSCGCTTPEYSKAPILPGKKSEIKITFDPEYRPGHFSKDVHILSNGSKNRNVIRITGEVIPKPKSLEDEYPFASSEGLRFNNLSANFKYVAQGTPQSMTIAYVNNSDKEVSLKFDISPNDGLVTVKASEKICPACSGDITITTRIPKGKKYGRYSYRVTPVINGKKHNLPITVTGIATDDFKNVDNATAPKFNISSNFRNFGDVKKGEKLTREFTIKNDGKSPLVIRSVETRDEITTTLKSGATIEPGGSLKISCSLDTSQADSGMLMRSVVMITNDPERPMREIRLAANVLIP